MSDSVIMVGLSFAYLFPQPASGDGKQAGAESLAWGLSSRTKSMFVFIFSHLEHQPMRKCAIATKMPLNPLLTYWSRKCRQLETCRLQAQPSS